MSRPTSITILALYLLIVFSLSLLGSIYGAANELPPYTRAIWLVLMGPKLLAIAAGIAFWRMLRLGAWLWFAGVTLGWVIALTLTGVWPSMTVAAGVSLLIVGYSVWAVFKNWKLLRPFNGRDVSEARQ